MHVLLLCIKIASKKKENVTTLSFMTQISCILIATLFKQRLILHTMTGPLSLGMGKGKRTEQKQIATGWS